MPKDNSYKCFNDLTRHQIRDKDYKTIINIRSGSSVAVIAPHGGSIEKETSEIAKAIAADDFNLYLFEGIRSAENYKYLHLSSHYFDDPDCLKLIHQCTYVISIHGCKGDKEEVLLGGLNENLKMQIAMALKSVGIEFQIDGHKYPGNDIRNICNRGKTLKGVQLEITNKLRESEFEVGLMISAIRSVLHNLTS